jgi:hypothetical protein
MIPTAKYFISKLWAAFRGVFRSDLDVMSYEVKQILSNKQDAELYQNAIDKIHSGEVEQVTITLSTGNQLTLIA